MFGVFFYCILWRFSKIYNLCCCYFYYFWRWRKRLVQLVNSHDDEVVAIACYDIGEFVRLYPLGKSIVKQFGTRNAIVKAYNEHETNDEIRHNALICLSKMLITNWKVGLCIFVYYFFRRILLFKRLNM
jgi:V-ATPase subunit H